MGVIWHTLFSSHHTILWIEWASCDNFVDRMGVMWHTLLWSHRMIVWITLTPCGISYCDHITAPYGSNGRHVTCPIVITSQYRMDRKDAMWHALLWWHHIFVWIDWAPFDTPYCDHITWSYVSNGRHGTCPIVITSHDRMDRMEAMWHAVQ